MISLGSDRPTGGRRLRRPAPTLAGIDVAGLAGSTLGPESAAAPPSMPSGSKADVEGRLASASRLNALQAQWLATLDRTDATPTASAGVLTSASAFALPLPQP